MDARLVALGLALVLSAGCVGVPLEGDGLLTAQEAAAKAERPGAQVVAISGVEGALPHRETEDMAFRDDGMADGKLGDGRLSSWVVALLDLEGYAEVRVFADGRAPVVEQAEVPGHLIDEQVFLSMPAIDSDEAARIAATDESFAEGAGRAAGYVYAYSLVQRSMVGSGKLLDDEMRPEGLGATVERNAWAITHVGADTATSQLVAMTAQVDAAAAAVLTSSATYLAESEPVFEGPVQLGNAGLPSTGPTVHHVVFDVAPGTHRLVGGLHLRPGPLLPVGETTLRVLMPDGEVLHEVSGDAWLPLFIGGPIAPGTWMLEVTSSVPTPEASIRLDGRLDAVVPVLPA